MGSGRYARQTSVSIERSQEEIKSLLRRYGVKKSGVEEDTDEGWGAIIFYIGHLIVRIKITYSPIEEFEFTPAGRSYRSERGQYEAWEQAVKQRWRALVLAVKSKLEAVEVGIATIEQEFMPYVVMPDGKTLSEHIVPQLLEAAKAGRQLQLPKLLTANVMEA